MNPLLLVVLYLLLFVAVTGVGRAGWEVYRNLKKGKRLSDEWGAITMQYIGLLASVLYYLLPQVWLGKSHGILVFVGVNLLVIGSFLRWRIVWRKPNTKSADSAAKQNTPERMTNR